jgi:putative spermidine/putrescine transport system ATP-binding protein
VGTPEDLFARPSHLDVAEFMGFRNRLDGRVTAIDGDMAVVETDAAHIKGRIREPVKPGDGASVAIRPDDLHPIAAASGALSAIVVAAEFRGREFVGFGRTRDGADVAFRSDRRLEAGETVHLGAAPDRVLVFAGPSS